MRDAQENLNSDWMTKGSNSGLLSSAEWSRQIFPMEHRNEKKKRKERAAEVESLKR